MRVFGEVVLHEIRSRRRSRRVKRPRELLIFVVGVVLKCRELNKILLGVIIKTTVIVRSVTSVNRIKVPGEIV